MSIGLLLYDKITNVCFRCDGVLEIISPRSLKNKYFPIEEEKKSWLRKKNTRQNILRF